MKLMKLIAAIGLLIAVSGTAQAIGIPAEPFVITLNDWDSGTVLDQAGAVTPAPGAWNITQDRPWAAGDDPTVDVREDSWGVFVIDHIYYGKWNAQGGIDSDTSRDAYYVDALSNRALIGMYYGVTDISAALNGTVLSTQSTNVGIKIWEQDRKDGGGNLWDDFNLGSAGRTGLDSFSGINDAALNPNLWVELEGVDGFISPANAEMASATQLDVQAGSGNVVMYLNVVANAAATIQPEHFGSGGYPYFTAPNGNTADLFLNMTTNVNNPTNQVGFFNGFDWTVVSNDDVVGVGVIPEPMTMVAVGLAVTSLGGYIRKRRNA